MEKIKLVQTTENELEQLISNSLQSELEKIKQELSNNSDEDKILTREETAKLLDVDLSSLWRWTKAGKIKAHGLEHFFHLHCLLFVLHKLS